MNFVKIFGTPLKRSLAIPFEGLNSFQNLPEVNHPRPCENFTFGANFDLKMAAKQPKI